MEQRRQSASDWVRIPAALRYDRRLSAKAKLLYGEIEALACRTGYCHAHNGYFCARLGMSDRTVTRLLAELVREGYLRLEVRRGPDRQRACAAEGGGRKEHTPAEHEKRSEERTG